MCVVRSLLVRTCLAKIFNLPIICNLSPCFIKLLINTHSLLSFLCFQINGTVRVSLFAVLLLQKVEHVRLVANRRVLRLHDLGLLRVLLDAGNGQLLRFTQDYPIHLCQHQDGLSGPSIDNIDMA